jgi:hypothetical protein
MYRILFALFWGAAIFVCWTVVSGPPASSAELSEDSQSLSVPKLVQCFAPDDWTTRTAAEFLRLRNLPGVQRVSQDATDVLPDNSSDRFLRFNAAYSLYPDDHPPQKHYLRTGLEILTLLGVGTALYWLDADSNADDWDLGWDAASWNKKLITGEGIAFDTNYLVTNAIAHPLTGILYYLIARTNNLSITESLLFAIAGSTFWEFVGEFYEKVSINDLIVTPLAGLAIGEVFAQLGAFFDRGSNTLVNNVLSTLFAPPRRFHNWLDNNTPRRTGNVDRLGFTRDIFHQFRLWTAGGVGTVSPVSLARNGSSSMGLFQVGLETRLVNIPGYHQPGQVSRLLTDGNFSTFLVQTTFGPDGLRDILFFTKAVLAGYCTQHIARDDDYLTGYSAFLGVATAFEYSFERQSGRQDDPVAVVRVLGTTVDLAYFRRGIQVHATTDVYGDFAMVHSYALQKHLVSGGTLAGAKSVLVEQHYYYAFGFTVASHLRLAYHDFEFGGELKYDAFNSFKGADRRPEQVTNDFNLTDQRASYKVWAAYTLPSNHFQLALSFEHRYRQGELLEVSDSTEENRYMGSLHLRF